MGIFSNWMLSSMKGTLVVPPPPELPEYDVSDAKPGFNWTTLWYSVDPIEQHPEKPKTGGVPKDDDKPDWRGVIKNNVIPLTPPERYKFGNYTPDGYFWFDTPDYADPFKKLRYAFYFMTKYGLSGTCIYAVMTSVPFEMKSHIYLLKRPFARFWLGGMTTSLAVIMLANLRGNVDDMYNYAIGGFIGGAVVGRKNHLSFLRQTFMFTIASMFVKWNAETNGKMTFIHDARYSNFGMALGSGGEYGFWSGDWRPSYFKQLPEDPGRGLRTHPSA